MAIYMKFGDFKGAVTTDGFKDWIELNSFQWGVGRGISSPTGGAEARESSNPSISEVTVTKLMDKSSPSLLTDAMAGELNSTVTIKLTTTTANKVTDFLSYELTNTGVSGYSVSSGGDQPTESLSLNFTKILVSYTGMDPETKGTPLKVGYDLTKMATT
jgi:type VI secretion system secreted protein Hcp